MIDTFLENSTSLIDSVVGPLNEAKIPFSSTSGVSVSCFTRRFFRRPLPTES